MRRLLTSKHVNVAHDVSCAVINVSTDVTTGTWICWHQLYQLNNEYYCALYCACNLLAVLCPAMASRKQLYCVYQNCDYSKAFDTVSHSHLIAKLNGYDGIVGSLLECFHSYLSNGTLTVKYGGEHIWIFLSFIQSQAGLSHLEPPQFNLFINNILQAVNSSCLLFVNDVKIYETISSPENCLFLQRSLAK